MDLRHKLRTVRVAYADGVLNMNEYGLYVAKLCALFESAAVFDASCAELLGSDWPKVRVELQRFADDHEHGVFMVLCPGGPAVERLDDAQHEALCAWRRVYGMAA